MTDNKPTYRQLEKYVERLEKLLDAHSQLEAELLISEEKFRTVADFTYDWEYWIDPEGNHVYVSPSCERITGYGAEEFRADPSLLLAITHPQEKLHLENHLTKELDPKAACNLDFRIIAKDGSERWISHICHAVHGKDGYYLGRRASNRDITDRKQLENALQASRKMLQTVLDTIPVRVFWKDRNSKYLGCNLNFAKDAGLALPEEIIGLDDFQLTWKEQAEIYRNDDQQVIASGEPKLNYEEPQTSPDGTRLWLKTSKIPLLDQDGNIIGMLGCYEDITERKMMENTLQKAREELEQRVRERTAELEETNVALKVLLKQREEDKRQLETQMVENIKQIIEPSLQKLKKSLLNGEQKKHLAIIETMLQEIMSPLVTRLSSQYLQLTPAEIQIANLIKQGKTTKEIAELLNLAPGTISAHRRNIRKKIGVTNQQGNLQSLLSSF